MDIVFFPLLGAVLLTCCVGDAEAAGPVAPRGGAEAARGPENKSQDGLLFGVNHMPGRLKPYQARVKRAGKDVHLGSFVTAEEAALCVARTPEGRADAPAKRAAQSAPPMTSKEARQQAQADCSTVHSTAKGLKYARYTALEFSPTPLDVSGVKNYKTKWHRRARPTQRTRRRHTEAPPRRSRRGGLAAGPRPPG